MNILLKDAEKLNSFEGYLYYFDKYFVSSHYRERTMNNEGDECPGINLNTNFMIIS